MVFLLLIVILSAFITGGVAMGGVFLSLAYEQKKEKAKQLAPSQPQADPHRVWELERELGIIPADAPPPDKPSGARYGKTCNKCGKFYGGFKNPGEASKAVEACHPQIVPASLPYLSLLPRSRVHRNEAAKNRGQYMAVCSTCLRRHYGYTVLSAAAAAHDCDHGRYTPSMQSAITYSARLQQPTPRPLSVPSSFSERVVPVHLSSGRVRYGYECNTCNEMWLGDTVEETYKKSCGHRDDR